jgi:N-ethylmaleimide reductase
VPASPRRALRIEEIAGIVEAFRVAAQRALDTGFNGFELHRANGYLVDQFIQDGRDFPAYLPASEVAEAV